MRTLLRRAIALCGLTAVVVVSGSIAAADGTAVRDITSRALATSVEPTDLPAPTSDTADDADASLQRILRAAGELDPTAAPDAVASTPAAAGDEDASAGDGAAVLPRAASAPDRGDRSAQAPAPELVWRASWYGPGFHGNRTANGEVYDQYAMTAAHKTLPFGTRLRVTNVANGRTVEVRINDRGPFTPGRDLDLSRAAADALGFAGVATVRVEIL